MLKRPMCCICLDELHYFTAFRLLPWRLDLGALSHYNVSSVDVKGSGMLNTFLTALGDVAALAAALFAFLALRRASETIREARDERREAELTRLRDRVEHVGEVLEAMASAASNAPHRFAVHRNRLGLSLAGLRERLPKCVALFHEVRTLEQFKSFDIDAARHEIDHVLNSFNTSLARRSSSNRPGESGDSVW